MSVAVGGPGDGTTGTTGTTGTGGPVAAGSGLVLRGVSYRYAGTARAVLDGVTLAVAPGSVLGVVGANESGKSTLCLVASGLAPAAIGGRLDGTATIDGVETTGRRPHELAQRCGTLFQNPATQLSGTASTVWEEVAFGPRNLGLGLAGIVDRVTWALETLRIVDLAPRDPYRLSGGQAQLVALASVLAIRPACLVLDEPTSQLDPAGTRLVGEALAGLAAETGTAILLVEHKTDLLARVADRIAVLDGGHVVREGPAPEVLGDPILEELGVEPPSAVRLRRRLEAAGLRVDPAVLAAVEHEAEARTPGAPTPEAQPPAGPAMATTDEEPAP